MSHNLASFLIKLKTQKYVFQLEYVNIQMGLSII